jgi:hypothetical protein
MRKLCAIALLFASTPAVSDVRIPHFRSMSEREVCGSVPNRCQPTNSRTWLPVQNLDYSGHPEDILGRSFRRSIYESEQCLRQSLADPTPEERQRGVRPAVERLPARRIAGTLEREGKSGFVAAAKADIDKTLKELTGTLPEGLQAEADATLTNTLTTAGDAAITLEYERIQLSTPFMDQHLNQCLSSVPSNTQVVVGASILKVSGAWTSTRIKDFIAKLEASAAFQAISGEAKLNWEAKKTSVLQGTFEPTAYIFAVTTRRGTGRRGQ